MKALLMAALLWGVLGTGTAGAQTGDPGAVVLDVRTAEEFAAGHLAQAKLLPFDAIDTASAAKAIPTKKTPVEVYCRSGRRSALAAQTLRALGYTRVTDLGGLGNLKGPLVR